MDIISKPARGNLLRTATVSDHAPTLEQQVLGNLLPPFGAFMYINIHTFCKKVRVSVLLTSNFMSEAFN